MSREEIIAKIKGIAENEKFKIDAFFILCDSFYFRYDFFSAHFDNLQMYI